MLELAPVSLKQANAYVKERHRHHGPVTGHKFSLGAKSGGTLVGVASSSRTSYHSLRRKRQSSLTPSLLLSPRNLRLRGDPRGHPVSRYLDDGETLEVTRVCTDGTKNACSFLYGAAWRAARAMGYKKLITYILDTESGASVEAAGFKRADGLAGGKRWTGKRKPPADLYPPQMKYRYERV